MVLEVFPNLYDLWFYEKPFSLVQIWEILLLQLCITHFHTISKVLRYNLYISSGKKKKKHHWLRYTVCWKTEGDLPYLIWKWKRNKNFYKRRSQVRREKCWQVGSPQQTVLGCLDRQFSVWSNYFSSLFFFFFFSPKCLRVFCLNCSKTSSSGQVQEKNSKRARVGLRWGVTQQGCEKISHCTLKYFKHL